MSLETHFNRIIDQLLSSQFNYSITSTQLIHCIDLTLLDDNASQYQLNTLQELAAVHDVAAMCVLDKHLNQLPPSNPIQLTTVVNFPQGNQNLSICLKQIERAKTLGVKEIDYVLPYTDYLTGNTKKALEQCKLISECCKNNNLLLKIILESGIFPNMDKIYQASLEIINLGCDFIKTSTGKITQGATLSAVFSIASAIKDSNQLCGLKVSGGVKTPHQALQYASLSELILGKKINKQWFRIGASSLLEQLLQNELGTFK